MISKEIFIQYEELYLPSGDGILMSFKNEKGEYSIDPKMLDESGNIARFHIPETYKFYCSNDLEHLSQASKAALAAAKELYIIFSASPWGSHIECKRIKAFKINIMGIVLYQFPFKPKKIRNYRWFAFYVEQE